MKRLIAGAAAAALLSTTGAASACSRVHRVTLPAVRVVPTHCAPTHIVPGRAEHRRVAHVHFETLGPISYTGDGWLTYVIEAHTTSPAYRWGKLRHGWHRFTRRTATFRYRVQDLPDCVFDGEPVL